MKKLILFLLLLATPVYASDVVVFDKQTDRVTAYLKSVNTIDYEKRDDVLINPVVPDSPQKYWKQKSGQIVTMKQSEIDDLEAAEAKAAKDAEIARIELGEVTASEIFKALPSVIQSASSFKEITEESIKAKIKEQRGL